MDLFFSHCSRETQFTRMVPVTLHQDSSLNLFLIQRRAYRRRATYGLRTPVHELCPRLGPIDTISGWQVLGFILSNLRGNGKMHVDELLPPCLSVPRPSSGLRWISLSRNILMILDLQNANNHAEFPHATGFRLKQELDASLYLGPQMDLIGFHEHLVE